MSAAGAAVAALSAPAALGSPAPQTPVPAGLDGAASSWATIVVAITVQALPFLLLGVLVSAALSALVPVRLLRRAAPSSPALAVPVAAGAGALLPGCECGSVPVARSLINRGVPPAAALAFLLASPAINPIVLVSTAVAYQGSPSMPIARLAASLLAAVLVGWAWIVLDGDARLALGAEGAGRGESLASGAHGGAGRLDAFRAAAAHDLLEAGGFLVVGPMVDLKLMAMQYGAFGRRFVARFVPLALGAAMICALAVGLLLL
ncbi:permease [Actinomyces timonensis]|uniref:Permease n=1 Tax=Actinomyces timonensis TaxID=1288391 RepID=A0AAU8N2X1_9ACTO